MVEAAGWEEAHWLVWLKTETSREQWDEGRFSRQLAKLLLYEVAN